MSARYDRDTARFFRMLAVWAALLLCAALVLCSFQSRLLRNSLWESERSIASSLLAAGVSKAEIAAAFSSSEYTPEGEAFMGELGRSADMALSEYPLGLRFALSAYLPALLTGALFAAVALWLCVGYCREREQLYRRCTAVLGRFVDGDYSERLPRAKNGALYHMLAAADNLAMTLESRSEGERKAREALREVISDISHQLKTPLAALRLYNDLIAQSSSDAETVRSFTEKASLSLDRIEGMIQTLLKVMRLDTGNVEFHRENCLVSDLAEKAVSELCMRAEVEGKTLIIEGDAEERLYCDPQWTSEALMNLVKNALDHTSSGCTVRVSWVRSPGMLRLSVSDDGDGISEQDLPFLFKRFYRSPDSRDIQGVGLGLALVKSVAEGQGGAVGVKSEAGRGSEFTVSFLTEV